MIEESTNKPTNSRRDFLESSSKIIQSSAVVAFLASLGEIRKASAHSVVRQEMGSDSDFEKLARLYSLDRNLRYLNHASIGTMPRSVQKARVSYSELCESNPWLHIWGDAWSKPIEQVRNMSASLLGCSATETAIIHNTTEMFNTLANGLPLNPNDEVLFSSLCHSGASIPFLYRSEKLKKFTSRRFDFPLSQLPDMTASQIVDVYAKQIKPVTKVLVLSHIDNTVGVRYPIEQLAEMARSKGVEYVVVDAAQSVGMIPFRCDELGIDVLATSGHKWLGGPKGTGIAYVNSRLHDALSPMWVTWGQNRWAASARKYEDYGTRNSPEVLALGDAIEFNQSLPFDKRESRLKDLWTFTRQLVANAKSLSWNSPSDWDLAGSLYSIRVKKPAGKLAKTLFGEHGIVVRPFTDLGLNNLRVSPNVFSSKAELAKLIELIA